MTCTQADDLRLAERQERRAAKATQSLELRRAHQDRAAYYAAILHGLEPVDPVRSLRACGAL